MTHTLSGAEHRAPNLDAQIGKFLDASQNLLSIVQHENAILMENGLLSFEAYISRKMQLMSTFEEEAKHLLSLISAANGDGKTAQSLLAEEIIRVREALSLNSRFQMDSLKQRIAGTSENAGGSACH
jgi:hypothetical protein